MQIQHRCQTLFLIAIKPKKSQKTIKSGVKTPIFSNFAINSPYFYENLVCFSKNCSKNLILTGTTSPCKLIMLCRKKIYISNYTKIKS